MGTSRARDLSPREVLRQRAHRGYPVRGGPWIALQRWRDVLFAHWPVAAESLESLLPSGLYLDRYHGQAWLGVVAFRISMRPRALPGVAFNEVNVRTYVHDGVRPGVYFFSLDASSRLAVAGARTLLNLPYFAASVTMIARGPVIECACRRGDETAELACRYWATGPARPAPRGTIEYFLTERYCLYGVHRWLGLYRLEIHHPAWPLQPASADVRINTMAEALDIALEGPPLAHVAPSQDVLTWAPDRIDAAAQARHAPCYSHVQARLRAGSAASITYHGE